MRRENLWRGGVYALGLLTLALGLTLHNKCALGTSAMSTTPYFASLVWGVDFGNAMFVFYVLCVAAELFLKPKGQKLAALPQVAVSLALSLALSWMDGVIRAAESPWGKALLLVGAVLFTGVGAAMCLNARLIPGAGDGIVEALSQRFGMELGLTKNLFDFFCMAVTFALGIATGHVMCALGVGTLVGVICVGRVMSVFERRCKAWLDRKMGFSA